MSDTIETADKLAKYRRPGQQSAAVTSSPSSTTNASAKVMKVAYAPYRLSKDTKRHLELRTKFPDPADCPLNSMITSIIGEWRRGRAVTLVYGKNMVVKIKGTNLQELFQALKDWKVDWLEEYDARFHLPLPDDKKAPFIASIEIITPKTEELPPMNQRH